VCCPALQPLGSSASLWRRRGGKYSASEIGLVAVSLEGKRSHPFVHAGVSAMYPVLSAHSTRAEGGISMTSATIPVVITLSAPPAGNKGILGRAGTMVQAAVDIDADKLKANLSSLVDKLGKVISVAEAAAGGLALTEVEVGIEITAEGGVALIGTAGAKASMTLTFKR